MPSSRLAKLKATLLTSGLSQTNNALYQLINQLISFIEFFETSITNTISSNAVDTDVRNSDLLSWSDESSLLPNSRELLAGTGIIFDDSVANERTITNELSDETILTSADESGVMPNSRRLVDGNYNSINTGTVNQIKVDGYEWSVLTNGDSVTPELIFADGDVIMVAVPS